MLRKLMTTSPDPMATFMRLVLALVFFPHGAQKVLGWFGGGGFGGTIAAFDQYMGIPAALTVLVMAAEFLGSIALAAGFLSRAAAAGIIAVMTGAVIKVHAGVGFFMDWNGTMQGEGFEYHILAVAIAIYVLVRGSGPGSLDRKLLAAQPAS